jgi:hypothetical protein
MDGKGEFTVVGANPTGGEPSLAPPREDSGAQTEQIEFAAAAE